MRSPTSAERPQTFRDRPTTSQDVSLHGAVERNPLFVGSVAKCFKVLEALNAAGRPVALTALAELAETERSAVQRITHTLKVLGYIRQHPTTRAYSLSGRMLEFGHVVLATDRVRAAAYPYLEQLSRATGETVNLMELEGDDIVYVARFPSVHAVSVDLHIGSRLPAFCTAAGRAILAHLPEADALARLGTAKRTAMTANTTTGLPGLQRILADVRRLGYALNNQEAFVGDISVAAAVTDATGNAVGAINIAVPSPRWKLDDVRCKLVPKVIAIAREISLELDVI